MGNVLSSPELTGLQYEAEECVDYPLVYQLGGEMEQNDACTDPSDPQVAATVYRHGNFDYANNDVLWDDDKDDHVLPDSLYLTAKPAFFGDRAWPFVQPDASVKVYSLRAKDLFDSGALGPDGKNSPGSSSDQTDSEGCGCAGAGGTGVWDMLLVAAGLLLFRRRRNPHLQVVRCDRAFPAYAV